MLILKKIKQAITVLLFPNLLMSQMMMDHNNHLMPMIMTETTLVMNQNIDILPNGCNEISELRFYTIKAGVNYISNQHDQFGYNVTELNVQPCSKVEITFENEDQIRHQLMIHGLPRYLYPQGMFHLEANGGSSVIGTLIVPPDNETYLIHCDLSRHAELGMRSQINVGEGKNDIPGIPMVSGHLFPDLYLEKPKQFIFFGTFLSLILYVLFAIKEKRVK
jgi:plastocyanin